MPNQPLGLPAFPAEVPGIMKWRISDYLCPNYRLKSTINAVFKALSFGVVCSIAICNWLKKSALLYCLNFLKPFFSLKIKGKMKEKVKGKESLF